MLSTKAVSDKAVYTVHSIGWEPYWIVKYGGVSGIFSDVMKELGKRVQIELVASEPLPVLRAHKAFVEGDIILECCINPAWRQEDGQGEVSLWSETVMTAEEVLIFPKGKSFIFSKPEDLSGKKVATIHGYAYFNEQYFERDDSVNNISLVRKVAQNRSDAGIIDRVELEYIYGHHEALEKTVVEIGPIFHFHELKLRIHSSKPEWVEIFNNAIMEMHRDGTMDSIIDSYL
ncbi:transporter substrate-binding domain-containing protein [Vibrio sp. Of7-15]|uniref:substrate-binding periplasmic protein n=1 Tax=Vibrio sp. Of7-15 TaxID=2724879 RepID=UPI001EF1D658|nr:ABC transporter substrate-binding protein [Vibrio sp. Of7-15]MCG7498851.1 transporter substrate-binding domain-containing protein [Vibrio sp. Of7-15]